MPERHSRGPSAGPRAPAAPPRPLRRAQAGAPAPDASESHLRAGFLAVAILTFVALSGCGGDGSGSESTAPVARGPASTETTPPAPQASAQGSGGETKPPKQDGEQANPAVGLPPKDQVDYAIKAVLASGLPALACDEAATQKFVETTFGDRGGCTKATVPASAASFVTVTAIAIDGQKATATAKPTGGPSDGETIRVKLVRQGGAWKVDSLRSNAPVGP